MERKAGTCAAGARNSGFANQYLSIQAIPVISPKGVTVTFSVSFLESPSVFIPVAEVKSIVSVRVFIFPVSIVEAPMMNPIVICLAPAIAISFIVSRAIGRIPVIHTAVTVPIVPAALRQSQGRRRQEKGQGQNNPPRNWLHHYLLS